MSGNIPPSSGSPAPPKGRRWFVYGCGGLLALLLIIVATVAITTWWIQRPIKPVVLTPKEKTVVDQKLREVDEAKTHVQPPSPAGRSSIGQGTGQPANTPEDHPYIPGAKMIKLTDREMNGLLNENTDLGKSVRLEFARDAINAYVAVPIPQDFPVGGGKMFRARGRFRLSLGNGGTPYLVLEDVSVFGISLPKAWLGGLKGENLLGDAVAQGRRGPVLQGVKSLHLEPGALVLELED